MDLVGSRPFREVTRSDSLPGGPAWTLGPAAARSARAEGAWEREAGGGGKAWGKGRPAGAQEGRRKREEGSREDAGRRPGRGGGSRPRRSSARREPAEEGEEGRAEGDRGGGGRRQEEAEEEADRAAAAPGHHQEVAKCRAPLTAAKFAELRDASSRPWALVKPLSGLARIGGLKPPAASSRLFFGGFNSEFSAASIFCEGLVFREVVLSRDFYRMLCI